MAFEITMPKLSDTMTEGLFAGWRKNVGDRIQRGDIIAEVETDKAVMELEAFSSGVLIKTLVQGGEQVPVGALLGLIGEPGEDAEEIRAVTVPSASGAESEPAESASVAAPLQPAAVHSPAPPPAQEHEKASPAVRRQAREMGIDLALIQGSGPEGRITQVDLDAFSRTLQPVHGDAAADAGSPHAPPAPVAPAPLHREPLQPSGETATPVTKSNMRQAIAGTVTRSWQTIPHFSVTMEIGMDACREIVTELKNGGHPIGYNALVIKSSAAALQHFPLLLSVDQPVADINISFAVSLDDGLLMPVIRGCQSLSLAGIQREADRLAEKSRSGRLTSEELGGGNFSISNLGMYGVDEFSSLIMPGQLAILAVGAVIERPVVRGGQIVVAPTMRVTLSSDHRTIDGAYAAAFLAEMRTILEKPVSLLM